MEKEFKVTIKDGRKTILTKKLIGLIYLGDCGDKTLFAMVGRIEPYELGRAMGNGVSDKPETWMEEFLMGVKDAGEELT